MLGPHLTRHCAPTGARLIFDLQAINISLLRSENSFASPERKLIRISGAIIHSHRRASIGSTFVARNAGM